MTEDQQVEAEDFKANQRTHSLKGQTLRYGFNRANNTKVTAVLGFKDIKTCLTWVDTQRKYYFPLMVEPVPVCRPALLFGSL